VGREPTILGPTAPKVRLGQVGNTWQRPEASTRVQHWQRTGAQHTRLRIHYIRARVCSSAHAFRLSQRNKERRRALLLHNIHTTGKQWQQQQQCKLLLQQQLEQQARQSKGG